MDFEFSTNEFEKWFNSTFKPDSPEAEALDELIKSSNKPLFGLLTGLPEHKIPSIDDIKTRVEDTKVGETCWDDCLRRNIRGKVEPGQQLWVPIPNPLNIHRFYRVEPLELEEWPSFTKNAIFEAEIWELRHQTKVIVWRRIK